MNFFQKLINTYKKGLQYDNLENKRAALAEQLLIEQENYTLKIIDNNNLLAELSEVNRKYEESKKTIQELINNKKLDIQNLKEWYENRREQERWTYNGGRLGNKDVRLYLIPSDYKPFTEEATIIINKYQLTSNNNPTQIITACYKYWNLRKNWIYYTDMEKYGVIDWWENPNEALKNRHGDCESKAMVMMNTMREALKILGHKEHYWRLTFVCSIVAGEGGHGYLTWLHDDGEYYVIESTYYEQSSFNKTWLRTPMRFNNMYQSPWGFATLEKSWRGNNASLMNFKDF